MEDNNFNSLSMYEVVKDRYGKKHKIFSVRFKDVKTVTKFTEKYNPDLFNMYLLSPVIDEDGEIEKDKDGNYNMDNGFYEDLVEIIDLALDGRESKEEIDEWLDMNIAKEIVEIFLGLSSFKKKMKLTEILSGETSSQE